jgi:hypothetical protein
MIRYDLYSNTASSEVGLQHHPALQELVENLRLAELEARFTRVQQREEGEMNLASAKFGGGVKVKSATVKLVPPETSLPGLLGWTRTVLTRVDRGLHLELERVRQTNGAGLALGRLLAQGRFAFITGLDAAGWARMTAVPDFTGQRIPEALVKHPDAQGEYLQRRQRPAGFFPTIKPLLTLTFLPTEMRGLLGRLFATRDIAALRELTDAQVINLGLVSDGLERYQKLLDQFYAQLIMSETAGELPALFDLLVQDIPFATVRAAFLPFVLEQRAGQARDNRLLVNEVRIGLRQADAIKRQEFQDALASLVLGSRLIRDPALYLKAARLRPRDPQELEALGPPRRLYLAFRETLGHAPPEDGKTPAPPAVKQALFELVVQLTYQAQYNHTFREGQIPPGVATARDLLSMLVFETFNIASLKTLNPNLPPRGVAKGLAEKTPVTWGEVRSVREPLERVLYPLAGLGQLLALLIHGTYRDADQQKKTAELSLFLRSGVSLLTFTNYILGQAGLNPLMREATLEAGRMLGLNVLESRDQVRARRTTPDPAGEEEILQGYVMMMNRDDRAIFPLRARPELLLLAYRYLYLVRVSKAARRFLAHKSHYLHERYGARLFEVIYQHMVWTHDLRLSRRQLGEMLIEGRVLERERLREFGFGGENMPRGGDNENAWLKFLASPPGEQAVHPFAGDQVESAYRVAYNEFLQVIQEHGAVPPSRPGQPLACRAMLHRLAEKEHVYHLEHPTARAALAACAEALELEGIVAGWVRDNHQTLLAGQERRETILVELPGPLGFLGVLKEQHAVPVEEKPIAVRLVPAWEQSPEDLDPLSKSFYDAIRPALESPGTRLRQAITALQAHRAAWSNLLQVSSVIFIDQALRESLLRLIVPAPPLAKDLIKMPEGQVLCLGTSSFDQGKFSRLVARPDRRDVYATLSDMASRLVRLQRLREEFAFYRDLIADIQQIIANFNVSYETAYMQVYSRALARLDQALSVAPEDITRGDLAQIQACAREISTMLNEIYEQERMLGLRDRWLGRTLIRLRQIRLNARINFVDQLHKRAAAEPEGTAGEDPSGETIAEGRESEFQTFSDRVREAIEFREWMAPKAVIVLSPSNTQQRLTMHLIDQLYRLKGIYLPILVNIAGCESFVDALLTRIPPHRLFNLNEL